MRSKRSSAEWPASNWAICVSLKTSFSPIAAKQQAFAPFCILMIDDVYLKPIKFRISDEMGREARA
jgi:hypothetical protein